MISLKHGFLFIHIPKTAGNSIQNILKDYSEEKLVCVAPHQDGVERFEVRSDDYTIHKHSTLSDYHQQLGSDVIDGLFKFTCVRNPWERMISFYFSPHRGEISWDRGRFISLLGNVLPTTDFISLSGAEDVCSQCFENMNHYIRYEELEAGFKRLCERISIPFTCLPRRNVSRRQHYSTYYDEELKELVRQRFMREITFFDYEFKYVN